MCNLQNVYRSAFNADTKTAWMCNEVFIACCARFNVGMYSFLSNHQGLAEGVFFLLSLKNVHLNRTLGKFT